MIVTAFVTIFLAYFSMLSPTWQFSIGYTTFFTIKKKLNIKSEPKYNIWVDASYGDSILAKIIVPTSS